jgi:hypothetical protein
MNATAFIEDLFIKKECRINDPWDAKGATIEEKKKHFTECAASRTKVRFIISVVVIVIIMIIISLIVGFSVGTGSGVATFLLGTTLLVGGAYAGTFWWQKRQARIRFETFEAVVLNSGNPAIGSEAYEKIVERQAQETNATRWMRPQVLGFSGY